MTDRWPTRLTPRSVSFVPATPVRRGPRSFSGVSQIVASDAGYWRATLTEISLRGDKVPLMRALLARMQGGLNPVLLGPWDCRFGPLKSSGLRVRGIPYADQATFADGAGFSQDAALATTLESLGLRDTSVLIRFQAGLRLEAGQYFGLGGDRLHIATSATQTAASDWRVDFWPPTRAALTGAQTVEIADPVCKMRLAADPDALALEMLRYGSISLDFEEAI